MADDSHAMRHGASAGVDGVGVWEPALAGAFAPTARTIPGFSLGLFLLRVGH